MNGCNLVWPFDGGGGPGSTTGQALTNRTGPRAKLPCSPEVSPGSVAVDGGGKRRYRMLAVVIPASSSSAVPASNNSNPLGASKVGLGASRHCGLHAHAQARPPSPGRRLSWPLASLPSPGPPPQPAPRGPWAPWRAFGSVIRCRIRHPWTSQRMDPASASPAAAL